MASLASDLASGRVVIKVKRGTEHKVKPDQGKQGQEEKKEKLPVSAKRHRFLRDTLDKACKQKLEEELDKAVKGELADMPAIGGMLAGLRLARLQLSLQDYSGKEEDCGYEVADAPTLLRQVEDKILKFSSCKDEEKKAIKEDHLKKKHKNRLRAAYVNSEIQQQEHEWSAMNKREERDGAPHRDDILQRHRWMLLYPEPENKTEEELKAWADGNGQDENSDEDDEEKDPNESELEHDE